MHSLEQSTATCGKGDEKALALLPVMERARVILPSGEQQRLQDLASALVAEHRALARGDVFGARVRSGLAGELWLIVGDTREIGMMGRGDGATYEYRASLLARPGDLAAFSCARNDEYERYRAEVLGRGPLQCLHAPFVPGMLRAPLAERLRGDPSAVDAIAECARRAGGLTVMPHIGMGSAWRLADTVAQKTGMTINVASPRPALTRLVNDKTWFARVTAAVLGAHALPPGFSVFGPATLASRARKLARSAERIVVKIPDSAGGAGNFCFSGNDLANLSLGETRSLILSVLRAAGWRDSFPLLVGLWEAPVLSSPSVQIWIPDVQHGPPVVEGVFEQLLEGAEGAFVGSIPATLPAPWKDKLASEAVRLASLFQMLGYFGRCSFDALLVGTAHDRAQLHWIECNGRWGGVSTPMTIVNQMFGERDAPAFVVVQRQDAANRPLEFSEALALLGDLLSKPGKRPEGIVLLSPVEIEKGTGVQLLSCSGSQDRATAIAREAVQRLERA